MDYINQIISISTDFVIVIEHITNMRSSSNDSSKKIIEKFIETDNILLTTICSGFFIRLVSLYENIVESFWEDLTLEVSVFFKEYKIFLNKDLNHTRWIEALINKVTENRKINLSSINEVILNNENLKLLFILNKEKYSYKNKEDFMSVYLKEFPNEIKKFRDIRNFNSHNVIWKDVSFTDFLDILFWIIFLTFLLEENYKITPKNVIPIKNNS